MSTVQWWSVCAAQTVLEKKKKRKRRKRKKQQKHKSWVGRKEGTGLGEGEEGSEYGNYMKF